MKKEKEHGGHPLLLIAAVATVVVLLATWVRKCTEDRALLKVGLTHSTAIDITPTQIRSIERIGQWEFLAVTDEELVDTIRHRTLQRDDRLVRIYKGTLRLGVDLADCEEGWVQPHGDTVTVTLPPIGLLSEHFIDEARTRSFYERGPWDARAREQMYQKAARQMKRRCLTPQNIRQAESSGRELMGQLFRSFGFKTVEVEFRKQ